MAHILVVEDDATIAYGLVYALEKEGYRVTLCKSVAAAENAVQNQPFDLAILDMKLPDGNGFDLIKPLANTSILFLTVVDDEGRIVRAFEQGAADYITKPFRLRELLARVKRILQMRNGVTRSPIVTLGRAKIDTASGKVAIDETVIELTALEYRLLFIFASHQGQLLTRMQILENIWDSSGNFVEDNTLTVYIKRLRKKLGEAVHIETVRGIGYRVDSKT